MSAIFPPEADQPPEPLDDVVQLRKPPHSEEAEQSVLGGLLIEPKTLGAVTETLAAADFYLHRHREIFLAICAVAGAGKPVDVITVFDELGDRNETVGGLSYLNALAQSVPSAANIGRYCEIVKERAVLRHLVAIADIAASRAFKNEPAGTVLDDLKVQLGRLQEGAKLGSGRLPALRPSQLREHAQATEWLIKHVIPSDSIGMIFGASQAFKSFVAIDAACHVAHGLPWMGRRTKKGPVVYIAAEGGGNIWKRVEAWHKARGLDFDDSVEFIVIPVPVELLRDAWRVVEVIQALGIIPAVVFVDTLSQTFTGEENSASDMAAYLREIGARIRALWHCAVGLLHHTGHNATERPRGSSAILANLDWAHGVFRDEKEMLATLVCVKQKDVEPFADAAFSLTVRTLGTDKDGDKVNSLVARHMTSIEEVQEAMEAEQKAGRGGHHTLFLSLLDNGAKEADVRKAFYDQCGLADSESKKRTYNRVKAWVVKQGFAEFPQGYVLTLKGKP